MDDLSVQSPEQIHPWTIKYLAEKANEVLAAYEREFSSDPAYFAPFLKEKAQDLSLKPWLSELASLEWALVQSQRPPQDSSETGFHLHPTLQILRLNYAVEELFTSKAHEPRRERRVLAVFLKDGSARIVLIKPEWLSVVDALEDGHWFQDQIAILNVLESVGIVQK